MKPFSIVALLIWCLAVILITGVVHLSSVFLMPFVAGQDSYARLILKTSDKGFRALPAPQAGDASLPFTDPGTTLAVCQYDLATGAWRVRVDIDNEGLTSLSFRTRNGIVFHTLTDRAALRGRLDVLLGTAAQIDAVEAADTDEAPSREVRLVSPSPVGMVFVRAMPPDAARRDALKKRLQSAECGAAG